MSVKIRLTRMGRKKKPFYRIVVADSRAPRDGRYIECVGTYNSITNPAEVTIQEDRTNYWLDQGATPSDTVRNILQHQGMMFKRSMRKRGFDDARVEEEMKKWEVLQIEKKSREKEKAEKKKVKAKQQKEESAKDSVEKPSPSPEDRRSLPAPNPAEQHTHQSRGFLVSSGNA